MKKWIVKKYVWYLNGGDIGVAVMERNIKSHTEKLGLNVMNQEWNKKLMFLKKEWFNRSIL